MTFKAGFTDIDISPEYFPIRTYLGEVNEIIDPIYAHAAVFSDGRNTFAFLSLDVVIVEWEYVVNIRSSISEKTDIPADHIMICTTHNHACPAVVERGSFKKELKYMDFMVEKSVEAVVSAYENLQKAEIGVASGFESRVSFNRRFIKKDGTVVTQPHITPLSDDILCCEGPIDPELGVISVKNTEGEIIGIMFNFSCHTCHLMGNISAGFPGVVYKNLKETYGNSIGCVFLNGPCGNIIHRNFEDPDYQDTKEHIGSILAEDIKNIIDNKISYDSDIAIRTAEDEIELQIRDISKLQECVENPEKFVNVFPFLIEKGWYKDSFEKIKQLKSESDYVKVVVQCVALGNISFVSIPAEYFVEFALRIKEKSPSDYTYVVSLANGWLGYIPTAKAFERDGGHETSTAHWSKMREDTGDKLAEKAIEMINRIVSP